MYLLNSGCASLCSVPKLFKACLRAFMSFLTILAVLAFAIVTAHSMEHTEAVDKKGLNVTLHDLHFF
jgi:predicted outer membrane lipoprotein